MPATEEAVADKAQAIVFAPSQSVPIPQGGLLSPQVVVPAACSTRGGVTDRDRRARRAYHFLPRAGGGISLPVGPDIPDREELTARLVAIVSERTGYPSEMLDLDLDLEADLGIDSIKRIEILGNYQKSFDFTADEDIAVIMEELAKIKTLRGVIEWVDTRLRGVVAGPPGDMAIRPKSPEHIDAEVWGEISHSCCRKPSVPANGAAVVHRYTLDIDGAAFTGRNRRGRDRQGTSGGRNR